MLDPNTLPETVAPIPTPTAHDPAPTISTKNLTYRFPDTTLGLSDITISLPPRSRTLLIGANGAGKSTLLRLLSGKRLAPHGEIAIGGVDPFKTGLAGVTYLGLEWVLNPIVRNDIEVWRLLDSVGGSYYKERTEQLVKILDVDVEWRMHAVSDGERRRVQLVMGLLRPWTVLLLDEVTVDLDVLARMRFLEFLRQETLERECTIVYATHILDGLASWPTHLIRMTLGEVRQFGPIEELAKQVAEKRRAEEKEGDGSAAAVELGLFRNSALLDLALQWLEEDLKERGPRKPRVGGLVVV